MLRNPSSRVLLTFLLSTSVFFLASTARSQDTQTESVADAARRAREQKKNAAKPVKVVTEDDMPAKSAQSPDTVQNAAAQPASDAQAPAANSAPAADASNQPATPPSGKDGAAKATDDPAYAPLKAQTDQAQKEIDLLQRDLSLQQDTFLSNPDYVHDTAGKAKLDGLREQIAERQEALEKLKAQLATHKPPAPAAPPKQ